MPKSIYYRIFGSAAIISTHAINSISMLSNMQDEIVLKDPEIRNMVSMQSRFLTIWNIAFQLTYAGLALTCDVLTVMNKDHLLPKFTKKFRDYFFSAIVFPGTLIVFTFFWPIFLYDRSYIFPVFIDKVFSSTSNYVMHLAILPYVLWELAFQPRTKPKSHTMNLATVFLYFIVYNIHIHVKYNEDGKFPYPLMYYLYGTIYYIYLQTFLVILSVITYYVQWPLYTLLWGKDKKISKKNK